MRRRAASAALPRRGHAERRSVSDESGTRWRFDGHAFELHPTRPRAITSTSRRPEPKAFVMWRMSEDGGDRRCFP